MESTSQSTEQSAFKDTQLISWKDFPLSVSSVHPSVQTVWQRACVFLCVGVWINAAWHLEADEKVDTATLLCSDWIVSCGV